MKTSTKGRFRADDEVDANLEFFQDEMPDHAIEVSNGEEFDWDDLAPLEGEFELVDDAMSQDEDEDEEEVNQIELSSDEELDMDQDEDEFGF